MPGWWKRLTRVRDAGEWGYRKFVTRARTLFYTRLALLALGLGILAFPRWAEFFGARGQAAFVWYFVIIVYSVASYLLVEKGLLGRLVTFFTLILDLATLVYMIAYSGGLSSPVLPSQLIYTVFFALLFPNPLAIVPPLLTLPVVAKIDAEIPGRLFPLEGLFVLVWYSAVNFIIVYVIVYLNEREDTLHNEIVDLQKRNRQIAVLEERTRLAREIHDGLGASLSSLIIQAEYLCRQTESPQLQAEIGELKTVAEESMDELRRSISMMRPDFELAHTLEEYCCTVGQRTGMEILFRSGGEIPRLGGKLQLAVFRVLQETLANARKHARASRVEVELQQREGRLQLKVADNGTGFDSRADLRGHYGLTNMRERARQFGGSFQVDSAPGQGCRVLFEVPLPAGPAEADPFAEGEQSLLLQEAANEAHSGVRGGGPAEDSKKPAEAAEAETGAGAGGPGAERGRSP